MAMLDHYGAAITAHKIGKDNHAVSRSHYPLAIASRNIDARVKGALSIEWINALPERACHRTFHRPQVRSRRGSQPVGCSHILAKS